MRQNNGIFLCKNFARKIHHFFCSFTLVLLLCLTPAHSAGYTCSTSKTYTSCNAGYYLSSGSCLSCQSGCTCAGGTAAPVCCSTSKSCSSSFSGYSGTYNECAQNQSSQCYKSCSVSCSGNDTSSCPANATCTYNTSYQYTGTQYYGGSCSATAGKCPLSSFTCNTGYYLSNGQCLVCTKGYYCDNGNRYACPSDYPLTDPRSEDYSNETSINGCWRDCNASDVPNSTARTGWKEYSGNNTCAATACAAGYYLESGACKKCPDGYTSANGTTGGIGSCYTSCTRACTQQTVPSGAYSVTHGITSTSGTQYYGGTCSATASTCTLTINKCKTGYYKSNNSCGACPSDYPLTDTIGNAYSDETSINGCWRSCNASDVPNSTARTGWKEYSGNNTCTATACAAGYYLESGACKKCPDGYTSANGTTGGIGSCYTSCTRACTQQTVPSGAYSVTHGTTSTSGTQYYGGTCSATASTCTLTINNCKSGYYKSNNSCGACPSDYPLTDPRSEDYSNETSINGCWRDCNASDVPNSTARTGWKEYSGNNTCAATACAAGYALSSGTCVSCPSGYTSSSGMTNGTAYCYKTCPAKTGYTLTGGVDYYSATDTCTYSANCNAISIARFCGDGIEQYIYKKTDATGWYSDSSCTTTTTKLSSALSTCSGWTNWGVSPNRADTTGDNNGSGLYFTADGNTTTAGNNWTVNAPATLYNVRAKPCAAGAGCSCSLSVSSSGVVDYTTGAQTGYALSSGNNTYAPVCSAQSYTCSAGKYLNGVTCTDCESGYWCVGDTWTYNGGVQGRENCPPTAAGSDNGRNAATDCYVSCSAKSISNGTTTVVNAKEYYNGSAYPACTFNVNCNAKYGASGNKTSNPSCTLCATGKYSAGGANACELCNIPSNSTATSNASTINGCSWTCNSGYNQTADNQCGQFCGAGITHLHLGNGVLIPLYSSARTSPAINVKWKDTVCYGSLSSGKATGLNVKVGTTTYHAVN